MKTKGLNSILQVYYFMGIKSKEDYILKLILESSPLKQWHFEEITRQAGMTRAAASKWLRKYKKEGLVRRVKEKNRFPYFTAGDNNAAYKSKKKIYALKGLHNSGLINHLMSLERTKTIIIFGSIVRWDWYKESDIDIFIYGDDSEFEQGKYELRLNREIQVHSAKSKKDLRKMGKLLPYIISGNFIKGSIQDLGVNVNIKT